MMRALRPDRMTYAVQTFVEEKLGQKYVENRSVEFSKSFEESGWKFCTNTMGGDKLGLISKLKNVS